jgi:DNA-binding XRE family transcriptional regulator
MKFRFLYKLESDGSYSARCLDFFICSARGATLTELKTKASLALHEDLTVPPHTCIYRSPPHDDSRKRVERDGAIDAATNDAANIFSVPLRPGAAFALSLREHRTQRVLMQRQVAGRLGMQISAYQRLEDPQRANPTLKTMARLRKIFPEFDLSDLFETEV